MYRRLRWLAALAVGLPLLAIALSVGVVFALRPEAPALAPLAGALERGQSLHEGRERTWLAYLPPTLGERSPLVLILHGSNQDADAMRRLTRQRFDELADRDGFIALYPEAWEGGGILGLTREWNDCLRGTDLPAHAANVDDVGFLRGLIERFVDERHVDPRRIYAVGFGDGGQLVLRLAAELSDRLAAVAVVAAQVPAPESSGCPEATRPLPLLIMNGTADPIVPFEGGSRSFHGLFPSGEVLSMRETLAFWRRVDGLQSGGREEWIEDVDPGDHSSVERLHWGREGEAEVVGYAIRGGGHTFPGGWQYLHPLAIGYTNRDIQAADAIWDFLRCHPDARA